MKGEQGSALVLSLLIISVLSILILSMSIIISNEMRIAGYEHRLVQAQHYIESVIEYAGYFLADDDKWPQGELANDEKERLRTYLKEIKINWLKREITGDDYIINSSINYEGVYREIKATYGAGFPDLNIFAYPLAAGNAVNINGKGINIGGEVAANGSIPGQDKIFGLDGTRLDKDKIHEKLLGSEEELELGFLQGFFAEVGNKADYYMDSNAFIGDTPGSEILYKKESGELVLDIQDKVVVIRGDIILNEDLYIKGSGILIIDGNINFNNDSGIHANHENGNFVADYAITYFTENLSFTCGYYRGMLVAGKDLNLDSSAMGNYEIRGGVYAGNNANLSPGRFIHDDGFVDVLRDIALKKELKKFIKFRIVDWQEFLLQ